MMDKTTKLELILADEDRIRSVTDSLSQIDALARVLNGDHWKEVPKLLGTLNKLLITHNNIKNNHGIFAEDLNNFLQDYAAFTLLMDENLHQYKTIINKAQTASSTIHDDPIE